jgi:3-dehydroquinate dehydratase type I
LAGSKARICAAIVNDDLLAIKKVAPLVDLFEVRIDLIGSNWREIAASLKKPWIACNRRAEEGGKWHGGEYKRITELLSALEFGAAIIDIELATPDIKKIVREIKGNAKCLISYHNIKETPPLLKLKEIIKAEKDAGADICKVATTARTFKDNLVVLKLIEEHPKVNIIAFAMGAAGQVSRILCPLLGGRFTYASIEAGKESAEGQITVRELRQIYKMLEK